MGSGAVTVDVCIHGRMLFGACPNCGHGPVEGFPSDTEQPPVTLAEGGSDGRSALAGVAPDEGVPILDNGKDAVKQILPAGAFMTSDHRYYFNGKGPVPSVTTILEVMSKPALVTWKAKQAAEAMWNALNPRTGQLPDLQVEEGTPVEELERTKDVLIKWALQQSDSQRDKAAGIGTSVHLLADLISRNGVGASESPIAAFQVSEEEKPYAEAFASFLAFLEVQGGRIVSSEHAVWSLNGYAGTYDLIVELPECIDPDRHDGEECTCGPSLWLIDIKTSKGYYPEYGLQLAGYRWADYIILPGNPTAYPMPPINRTAVLHLRPDIYGGTGQNQGWRLIEYPTTYTADYLTFLGCLEVYKWRKEGRFSKSNLNTVT